MCRAAARIFLGLIVFFSVFLQGQEKPKLVLVNPNPRTTAEIAVEIAAMCDLEPDEQLLTLVTLFISLLLRCVVLSLISY